MERCLRMIPRWLPCETSAFHLSTSERNATNSLTDWHCSWVKLLINALAVLWCGWMSSRCPDTGYSSSEWPVYRITKKWSIILPKAEERIVRWVRSIEQIKEIRSEFVVLAELFWSPGVRRWPRIMLVYLEVWSGVFEQAFAQLWGLLVMQGWSGW